MQSLCPSLPLFPARQEDSTRRGAFEKMGKDGRGNSPPPYQEQMPHPMIPVAMTERQPIRHRPNVS